MDNYTRIVSLCTACLFLLALPVTGLAVEEQRSHAQRGAVGIGADFSTGTYGGAGQTSFLSIPVIIDIFPAERIDAELEIPLVYQSNTNNSYGATITPGTALPAARTASRRFGQGDMTGTATTTAPLASNQSAAAGGGRWNLGDMALTVGYAVVEEHGGWPRIRSLAYLKFPTGNRDEGTGTGEFDAGGGISVSKWYGAARLMAEALYVFQGRNDLYPSRDYLSYSSGVGWQATERLLPSLTFRGKSPMSDGEAAQREARVKIFYEYSSQVSVEGYAGTGFSESSPDFSAGLTLLYGF